MQEESQDSEEELGSGLQPQEAQVKVHVPEVHVIQQDLNDLG